VPSLHGHTLPTAPGYDELSPMSSLTGGSGSVSPRSIPKGVSSPLETPPTPPTCPPAEKHVLVAHSTNLRPVTRSPPDHHRALLRDAATLHRRFGIQSEGVFRALEHSAKGVARLKPRDLDRFVSGASARASTHRTAVRNAAVPKDFPDTSNPGMSASLDLTRQFLPDVDGFVCAAIFMDRHTWNIWIGPMKDHSCTEFIRVLQEYQAYVRATFNNTLRHVLADSDPCFTDNSGIAKNVGELQRFLDALPVSEAVNFVHSPPYTQSLNPVECAVRQLYHLMNFFLQ